MIQDLGRSILSMQKALLHIVTPELRAVIIDLDNNKNVFFVRFYYDGIVNDTILDLWRSSIKKANAELHFDFTLDSNVERLDFPQEIPFRGRCVFLRKE